MKPRTENGCSVPAALKRLDPALRDFCETCDGTCCYEHDHAYLRGGTEEDRNNADAKLYQCGLASGVPEHTMRRVYAAVQMFGGNHFGVAPWHGNPFPHRSEVGEAP